MSPHLEAGTRFDLEWDLRPRPLLNDLRRIPNTHLVVPGSRRFRLKRIAPLGHAVVNPSYGEQGGTMPGKIRTVASSATLRPRCRHYGSHNPHSGQIATHQTRSLFLRFNQQHDYIAASTQTCMQTRQWRSKRGIIVTYHDRTKILPQYSTDLALLSRFRIDVEHFG